MGHNQRALNKLKHWERMLRTAPVVLDASSRKMGQATLQLIVEGFRHQRDPYGKPWAPKRRPDGRPVLTGKTKRLRSGWRLLGSTRRGFRVRPSVDYATPHQDPRRGHDGRLRRPRRMMVPSARRGLPHHWRLVYKAVSKAELRKHFRGA